MDYFDIDEILSQQEGVPCEITRELAKYGHLDPLKKEESLMPGTKLALPLWLVSSMQQQGLCKLDPRPPKSLDRAMVRCIEAGAQVLSLPEWCAHFFAFGLQYAALSSSLDIKRALLKAFQHRYSWILDLAASAMHNDVSDEIRKLETFERRLFEETAGVHKSAMRWEDGSARPEMALAILHARKRKAEA